MKTTAGLIVSKFHGWRNIRVISNAFKIALERFKKFREENFMLNQSKTSSALSYEPEAATCSQISGG